MRMILMPLALVIMAGVVMAFLPVLTGIETGCGINEAISLLTGNGYYVVASGQCAATNIVPCTDSTYDLSLIHI